MTDAEAPTDKLNQSIQDSTGNGTTYTADFYTGGYEGGGKIFSKLLDNPVPGAASKSFPDKSTVLSSKQFWKQKSPIPLTLVGTGKLWSFRQ